ncbi:MAG: hypothetical protein DMG38_23225 [Acidobacteria bacterium]|nr:MAG: hypothetical protein DMG38_23225 [Acidobacteriota bacterium]
MSATSSRRESFPEAETRWMNASMKTARTTSPSVVTWALAGLLASAIFLSRVSCTVAAAQQTGALASEVRFPVAHAHTGSWCLGYLYISADSIRYEVIRPDKDKKHSFRVSRSDLTVVQQWVLLGTPEKATEIKTAHGAYHFWWMPNENDLQPGQPSLFNPRDAADPSTLIAAIRDPSTVLSGTGTVGQTPGAANSYAPAPGSIPPASSSPEISSGTQPLSTAPATVGSAVASAPRGRIGLGVTDLPSPSVGLSHGNGALVTKIEPEGPAAQAGVRVHDVITALNGAPIGSAADVRAAMTQLMPGSMANLQILRDSQPFTVTVNVIESSASLRSSQRAPFGGAAPPAAELFSGADDSAAQLLVSGNPPLTSQMVNKGIGLFEWLLDAQLTIEQRAQFRDSLVDSWKTSRRDDIDATVNVLNFQDQLGRKTPEEQRLLREVLREKYLDLMRQTPNDVLSRWVLNIYDSAHRPIADGNPPLTLQVADAYAEFVAFMVTECLHKKAFIANRHFKDQLAQSLAAKYSSYSGEQQKQFSQIPLLWEALRFRWARLSEPERQTFRQQWIPAAQSLLAGPPEAAADDSAAYAGAPGSAQNYVESNSERLFVNSMCNSSFASTMSLHLSMWH